MPDLMDELTSAKEDRTFFGNSFSSADTCMYLDKIGHFGFLAPMYSSGSLDIKLFNRSDLVKPLYEYIENSLNYFVWKAICRNTRPGGSCFYLLDLLSVTNEKGK